MKTSSLFVPVVALIALAATVMVVDRNPNTAHAMTAQGNQEKSMVTVPVDSQMEAVVTLDHKTGDLVGYVLNRINGQFFVRYRYNVTQDFPGSKGNYLMGAGLADFRGFRNNERLGTGVVYIAEANSTQVAAYAIPWNTQLAVSGARAQQREFILLDRAQTRFSILRQ